MKHFKNPNSYVLVVAKGENLMASLEAFAASENLKSAWMNGLGASSRLTLGSYNLDNKEFEWAEFNDLLEITSLQGNLSWVDDKPFWHVHGTFSGHDFKTLGGHVKDLTIGVTGELLITPMDAALTRTYDEETGLKLLSKQ